MLYFATQSLRTSSMKSSRSTHMMNVHEALAQITSIRGQVARSTTFRGYGPASLALTGLLAFLSAWIQSYRLPGPHPDVAGYLALWALTAALALSLITMETATRARRMHAGLVSQMLRNAVEPFVPAVAAGALLAAVLLRFAHGELWMLPGLWQILFSLGVFSSCRFLPKQTVAVGVWYLGCGMTCLALGHGPNALAPWEMGVPFGVGHLMLASILYLDYLRGDEDV